MSYIAYINDVKIDISPTSPISQTKQVNDLAMLSNRQSNYTNTFKIPINANNTRALNKINIVVNQSNITYQKNVFNLIDSESGVHLIYNGWAIVKKTTKKEYEIYVYDGIIDFYKSIENKSLTEIGVQGLNHLKNLTNIVSSFANDKPYMYILADYNGKNICAINNIGKLNVDYQVPSARVSYIWDRIMLYAGYTYSGNLFETPKFLNLFMTFPKPVPISEPSFFTVTRQSSEINVRYEQIPTPNNGIEYVQYFNSTIFPSNFNNIYAEKTGLFIKILTAGTYRISASGSFDGSNGTSSVLQYNVRNVANQITQSGSFDVANQFKDLFLNPNDILATYSSIVGEISSIRNQPLTGQMNTTLNYILGYEASFDEVFIDFKATDFINEVMQRFGLTMYKNKYDKSLEFKFLKDVLNDENVIDWSDKFSEKLSESYIFGNYAQKNIFAYRYNETNDKHNNGSFDVLNENLKDEAIIVKSLIYSPENKKSSLLNRTSNVYKIWDKEVKDNATVEYKDLSGRYYFLRAEPITENISIASESLNTNTNITNYQIENYDRLNFQEVIYDNYLEIGSVVNKAKVFDCEFYLNSLDIERFDFKKLVFVDKLGSNFIVNKIKNFIPNKKTIVELIKVNLLDATIVPINYYITLVSNILNNNCTVTLNYLSNIPIPVPCIILCKNPDIANGFITSPGRVYEIPAILQNGIVTISITSLPTLSFFNGFTFRIKVLETIALNVPTLIDVISNDIVGGLPIPLSCFVSPLKFITITNINTYQLEPGAFGIGITRKVRIDFTTDLLLPNTIEIIQNGESFEQSVTDNFILLELSHTDFFTGQIISYNFNLKKFNTTSNTVTSNQ